MGNFKSFSENLNKSKSHSLSSVNSFSNSNAVKTSSIKTIQTSLPSQMLSLTDFVFVLPKNPNIDENDPFKKGYYQSKMCFNDSDIKDCILFKVNEAKTWIEINARHNIEVKKYPAPFRVQIHDGYEFEINNIRIKFHIRDQDFSIETTNINSLCDEDKKEVADRFRNPSNVDLIVHDTQMQTDNKLL